MKPILGKESWEHIFRQKKIMLSGIMDYEGELELSDPVSVNHEGKIIKCKDDYPGKVGNIFYIEKSITPDGIIKKCKFAFLFEDK